MKVTIAKAADRAGLTASTLRYYEKEGLLPFVERSSSGIRAYRESDFEWLQMIHCLKSTGMPLREIKQYLDWCMQGDCTLKQRLNLFKEQKARAEQQLEELREHIDRIDYKIGYYEAAVKAGTEKIYQKKL